MGDGLGMGLESARFLAIWMESAGEDLRELATLVMVLTSVRPDISW